MPLRHPVSYWVCAAVHFVRALAKAALCRPARRIQAPPRQPAAVVVKIADSDDAAVGGTGLDGGLEGAVAIAEEYRKIA
jgi:hypothetical protein